MIRKRTIKLTENRLRKMIRESVRRVLSENKRNRKIRKRMYESEGETEGFADDDDVFRHYGIDPDLITKLYTPKSVPIFDGGKFFDRTDQFGIDADIDTGELNITLGGFEAYEHWDQEEILSTIQWMTDDIKHGAKPENVWAHFARDLDMFG